MIKGNFFIYSVLLCEINLSYLLLFAYFYYRGAIKLKLSVYNSVKRFRFNLGTARRRISVERRRISEQDPKLFHKTLYLNPVTSLRRATRRPEGSPYFSGNFGRGRDKSRQRSRQLPSSRNRITDITEVAALASEGATTPGLE